MTHTSHRNPAPLRDVLYELSLAQDVPDAEILEDFVRRYPEHAVALTEFAVELAVDSLRPEAAPPAPESGQRSPAVSRAMSKFENALHGLGEQGGPRPQGASRAVVENPFLKYDTRAFRQLAKDLNANSLFACKLRDREIQPSSMTAGFRSFVAGKMALPPELLAAHFSAPVPTIPRAQSYRSDQKPEAGSQQSFEEAVRSSNLSEEQQRFLLDL